MRTIITIVGVGDRRQGIGKNTNKPYDFTPISFTFDSLHMTGVEAATVNLNQDCCPPDYVPSVGDSIEAFIRHDYKTNRIYIDGVC